MDNEVEVLSRENMTKAIKRVEANKGAAGVDNMTVSELKGYLKQEWPRIHFMMRIGV